MAEPRADGVMGPYPLPVPQPETITQRRMLGQSARHDLDDYRHAKAMAWPDRARLASLVRANRKIRRLAQLEGFTDLEAVEVVLSGPPGEIPVPPG